MQTSVFTVNFIYFDTDFVPIKFEAPTVGKLKNWKTEFHRRSLGSILLLWNSVFQFSVLGFSWKVKTRKAEKTEKIKWTQAVSIIILLQNAIFHLNLWPFTIQQFSKLLCASAMGLRARKCKPSLGKVTKKPGLLKGTGEKTMSPSSKFLAITICHLNNALEYKPPSFKPLPPLKYLRFDPESLPSLVCSMGCAWDLRISALQCSNIPAFSLRAQVGRGIVAAPWLSTFVMSECACSCTRSHTTPELAPTKVWRWFLGASGLHWLPYGYIASTHAPSLLHSFKIQAPCHTGLRGLFQLDSTRGCFEPPGLGHHRAARHRRPKPTHSSWHASTYTTYRPEDLCTHDAARTSGGSSRALHARRCVKWSWWVWSLPEKRLRVSVVQFSSLVWSSQILTDTVTSAFVWQW